MSKNNGNSNESEEQTFEEGEGESEEQTFEEGEGESEYYWKSEGEDEDEEELSDTYDSSLLDPRDDYDGLKSNKGRRGDIGTQIAHLVLHGDEDNLGLLKRFEQAFTLADRYNIFSKACDIGFDDRRKPREIAAEFLKEGTTEEVKKAIFSLCHWNSSKGIVSEIAMIRKNESDATPLDKKIVELIDTSNRNTIAKEIATEVKKGLRVALRQMRPQVDVNICIMGYLDEIQDVVVGETTGEERIKQLNLAASIFESLANPKAPKPKFTSEEQKNEVRRITDSIGKFIDGVDLSSDDYPKGVREKNIPSPGDREKYGGKILFDSVNLWKQGVLEQANDLAVDLAKEEERRKQQQQQQQQEFEKAQREIEKQYHEQEVLKETKETHKEKMWNYAKNDTAALGKDFAIGFGLGVLAFAAIAMTGVFAAPLLLLPLVFGGLNVARKYEQQERHKAQAKRDDLDIRRAEKKLFDLSEQHLDLENKSEVNLGVKMDRHIRSHAEHVRGNNKGMGGR